MRSVEQARRATARARRSGAAWPWRAILALLISVLASGYGRADDRSAGAAGEELSLIPEFSSAAGGPFPFGAQDLSAWRAWVPGIEPVEILRAGGGGKQRALFYDPRSDGPRPLLVVLHSWSEDYLQNIGIPYGVFAQRNGWVLVHPDHRGPYRRPEATASELALKDVLDAVAYARARADVDPSRIYLAGYSGSAMTALVLAAKHPETFAAVVAWAPIYDLVDWYELMRATQPQRHYLRDIAASCGGPPLRGTRAEEECRRRSPSVHLRGAGGRVHVLIAAGIWDHLVPPDHALRAFNDLAAPGDRIGDEDLAEITRTRRVPAHLRRAGGGPLFKQAGAEALLMRTSQRATLVVFQGGHDLLYNAGLAWLAGKRSNPHRDGD